MQPLAAPPRTHLTEAQVIELLTGDDVTYAAGLELLDTQNRLVEDISGDLNGGSITHDGRSQVNGDCSLQISRPLAWGRDRVRPYMTLSRAGVEARFNVGVFVLTTPVTQRGETPITYSVTGYDLLQPLLGSPGDTYVVIPDEGDDTIGNSTFEGGITGWESNSVFGLFQVAAIASSTLHPSAGTKSMQITWPTTGAGGVSWVDCNTNQFVVGKTYRFEADLFVLLDAPDQYRFDIAFVGASPWFTAVKGASNHFEWLWTATRPDAFVGLTTHDATAGQKCYLDEFHVTGQSTTCLDAVKAVIEASGVGAPIRLDGTEQVAVMPGPMVWALTESSAVSWLQIINDLLAAVNYRELWVDENGTYRSEPYLDPAASPEQWTFDTSDEATNIVAQDRTVEEDVWGAPNWWRFVRRGMDTTPTEGNGIYTVQNTVKGPASQMQLEQIVRKPVQFLDAVDQASLVAQGDRIVVEDISVTRTLTLSVDPLPIVGHLDVVRVTDAGDSDRAVVISSTTNLDGSPGQWVLEVVR